MYKDVKHLKKDLHELRDHYKHDIENMKIEIANKAEKEMLLENQ
jgi:5'-3' exonuclease